MGQGKRGPTAWRAPVLYGCAHRAYQSRFRTIALWLGLRGSIRAFSLAAVCAAAIATAHAQELGIVVEQPVPATSQPAAEPDKQGTQTNVKPGSSDQRSLHPAQTTQEPAHAAPVQVDPIVALARKRLAQGARGDEFDRADREALKAHYAEPGRTPMWVAAGELSRRAKDVMAEIGRAEGWGLSSAAFELPDAKLARVSPAALAEAELKLGLAVLKYARHARGGRVDPMQTGQSGDHRPTFVAPKAVLSAIGNAEKPDAYLRGLHPKHPQFLRLRQALMKLRDSRPGLGSPTGTEVQRIVLNMERWRWMPANLGDLYVWDNIPEYTARIVKRSEPIHSTKIIVGKINTQTPVFSASMRTIVFHPEWNVPDSIKAHEIVPHLRPRQGSGHGLNDIEILRQHNLYVTYKGQLVDASNINWSEADIRSFNFIQPAGPKNVLGVVKFLFPNRHDVYMHDTPERFLFDKQARTFSHGCIRVQDPARFAEIILGEDKGWTSAQIGELLSGTLNNEIALSRSIPVHVTYFTAVADADGIVRFTGDPYRKDAGLAAALAGRPVTLDIAPEPVDNQVEASRRRPGLFEDAFDILSGLFGN